MHASRVEGLGSTRLVVGFTDKGWKRVQGVWVEGSEFGFQSGLVHTFRVLRNGQFRVQGLGFIRF